MVCALRGVDSDGGELRKFKVRFKLPSLHAKSLRILKLGSCRCFTKIALGAPWGGGLGWREPSGRENAASCFARRGSDRGCGEGGQEMDKPWIS